MITISTIVEIIRSYLMELNAKLQSKSTIVEIIRSYLIGCNRRGGVRSTIVEIIRSYLIRKTCISCFHLQ